ncbi:hypothetical protein GCM10018966_024170 [Streptomyces yanii]
MERGSGPYWYRGWMIPASRYGELERALTARGCSLVTDASAYRRAHELPGWYEVFAGLTPRSVWRPVAVNGSASGDEAPAGLAALVEPLGAGPGIVKDFVKSRKHEWHEACYVPELTDRVHLLGRRTVLRAAGGTRSPGVHNCWAGTSFWRTWARWGERRDELRACPAGCA